MTQPAIRLDVEGLDALRRELRRLDAGSEWTDELKDVNKDVADVVVTAARRRAFTPLQRKAAQSLRASRQAKRAQITGGGARFPFFGGAEFGAGQDRIRHAGGRTFRGYNQFDPWTGSDAGAGYFLYPAIRASRQQLVDMYGDAIEDITRRAFPH